MSRIVVVITLVAMLVLVNVSIWSKERHLAQGDIIYLELAPVDPRSLMQGDYMTLRFAIADDLQQAHSRDPALSDKRVFDGAFVAQLDDNRVARFSRLASNDAKSLADDEILITYRVRNKRVKFATNAYFFKEGTGQDFTSAEYGQFRVNDAGEPLLTALYGDDFMRLGTSDKDT